MSWAVGAGSRMSWLVVSTIALAFASLTANAADQTATWNGTTGVWGLDTNWDITAVPNNNGQTFDAIIGDATGPVTLDTNVEIDSLTLGASELFLNFFSLTLNVDSTINGTLHVDTFASDLVVNGDVGINGAGDIRFGARSSTPPFPEILAGTPGAQLTIGPDIRIFGDGFGNGGFIDVDIVNNGQVLSANMADISFGAVIVDNTNGRLSADTPPLDFFGTKLGVVELNGTTVIGGTLDGGGAAAGAGGQITAQSGATLDGAGMTIDNVTVRAIDLTMRGNFENNGRVILDEDVLFGRDRLRIDGRVELSGNGSVLFTGQFLNEVVSANGSPDDVLVIGTDQTLGIMDATARGTIRAAVENDGLHTSSSNNLTTSFTTLTNNATGTVEAVSGGKQTFQNSTVVNNGGIFHADTGSTIDINSTQLDLNDGSTLSGPGTFNIKEFSTVTFSGTTTSTVAALNVQGGPSGVTHNFLVDGPAFLLGDSGVHLAGRTMAFDPVNPGAGSTDSLSIGPDQWIYVDGASSVAEVSVPIINDGEIAVLQGEYNSRGDLTNNNLLRAEGDGRIQILANVFGNGQINGNGTQPVSISGAAPQQIDNSITATALNISSAEATFSNTVNVTGDTGIDGFGNAIFNAAPTFNNLTVRGAAQFNNGLSAASIETDFNSEIINPGTIDHDGPLMWRGTISGAGTFNANGDVDISFGTLDGQTFNANGTVNLPDQLTLQNGATFINNSNETVLFSRTGRIGTETDESFINRGTVSVEELADAQIDALFFQDLGAMTVVKADAMLTLRGGGEIGGDMVLIDGARVTFTTDPAEPTTTVSWNVTETTSVTGGNNARMIIDGQNTNVDAAWEDPRLLLDYRGALNLGAGSGVNVKNGAFATFFVDRLDVENLNVSHGIVRLMPSTPPTGQFEPSFFTEEFTADHARIELVGSYDIDSGPGVELLDVAVVVNSDDVVINSNGVVINGGLNAEKDSKFRINESARLGFTPNSTLNFDETSFAVMGEMNVGRNTVIRYSSPTLDGFTIADGGSVAIGENSTVEAPDDADIDNSGALIFKSGNRGALWGMSLQGNIAVNQGDTGVTELPGIGDLDVLGNGYLELNGGVLSIAGHTAEDPRNVNFEKHVRSRTSITWNLGDNLNVTFDHLEASDTDVVAGQNVDLDVSVPNSGSTVPEPSLKNLKFGAKQDSNLDLRLSYTSGEAETLAQNIEIELSDASSTVLSVANDEVSDFVSASGAGEIIANEVRVDGNGMLTFSLGMRLGFSAGTLNIAGDLDLFDSDFEFEIGGLMPGTEYDQLLVDGELSATNLAIDLALLNGAESFLLPEDAFTLIDTTDGFTATLFGGGALSGDRFNTVDGLGSFELFFGATSPFGANSLVATNFEPSAAVPLPAAFWMLLSGIGMLLGRRSLI